MTSNNHHVFWPKNRYTKGMRKIFRQLPCNQVRLDENTHRMLHMYTEPPQVPHLSEMKAAIRRHQTQTCACYEWRE